MSRSLTHAIAYPGPVEHAWSMISDPAYQRAKLLDAGAADPEVTIEVEPDGATRIVLERDNPVQGIPAAVRRLVGETAHVVEEVSWSAPAPDGSRTAGHDTHFIGAPVTMGGTMTLAPSPDGGATLTLTVQLHSAVPLLGGKVEQAAADQTVAALDREAAFAAAWEG